MERDFPRRAVSGDNPGKSLRVRVRNNSRGERTRRVRRPDSNNGRDWMVENEHVASAGNDRRRRTRSGKWRVELPAGRIAKYRAERQESRLISKTPQMRKSSRETSVSGGEFGSIPLAAQSRVTPRVNDGFLADKSASRSRLGATSYSVYVSRQMKGDIFKVRRNDEWPSWGAAVRRKRLRLGDPTLE